MVHLKHLRLICESAGPRPLCVKLYFDTAHLSPRPLARQEATAVGIAPTSLTPATTTSKTATTTATARDTSAIATRVAATAATIRTIITSPLRTATACSTIPFERIESPAIDLIWSGRLACPVTGSPLRLPGAIVQHTVAHLASLFRLQHRVPVAVVPFGPVAVLIAAVDISISTRINVVTLRAHEASPVRSTARDHSALIAASNAGRVAGAVGKTFCVDPVVATLPVSRSPTAVDVRTLTRGGVSAGARVICLRCSACSVWSISKGAPRIRSRAGIVASAEDDAAVWSIDSSGSSVYACIRVVPGAVSIRAPVGVIDRIVTAVPVIGRVVPAGAPDSAAPAKHHTRVAGIRGKRHPIIALIVVLDCDVRHAVCGRTRRDLVDLTGDRTRDRPRSIGQI